MELVQVFFWVCALAVAMSIYYLFKAAKGKPALDPRGQPLPWWVWGIFLFVGVLGLAATGPGIYFNNPLWLTDKIFWLVGKLIG